MWDTLIIQPFTNVLLMITMLVKNFGLAIILFTILIKLITFPLTAKQIKSTQAVQELQKSPRYLKLQEKYKDNKEKLAEEQFKLQRELGVSPFGSCLPLFIQFPIIIGLYQSIMRAMASTPLELIKLERIIYPFLDPNKILPLQNRFLWMDLGQPERLTVFGIGIPVLTILVVLTTLVQSRVMAPPTEGGNDQAAAMTSSMNMTMPVVMGMLAYQFSAGLALYLVVSNLTTIAQYAAMGRTDWSKILPWVKSKPKAAKPSIVIPDLPDEEEEAKPVIVEKVSKPSARASVKRQRPKMKK
ncbi:MAG: YidC/Oxa1 family membrane protein insertase [Chloroflexi bacterium]|jgi:YidC/Oxa1 family membrane protein insertase|nr:YidC/Oxa1 family membrane protein insertase [Chloroflexota bacterium]